MIKIRRQESAHRQLPDKMRYALYISRSSLIDLLIHLILFYLYVCNDLYQPPLIMGEKHVLCLDLITKLENLNYNS